MALSPLIIPDAVDQAVKKSKHAAAVSSNGGTQEVGKVTNGTGHDVAEQMNEDEKSKYVKGKPPCLSADPLLTIYFQARSLERERMPMFISGTSNQTPQSLSQSRK
jgi:hypothetical protein